MTQPPAAHESNDQSQATGASPSPASPASPASVPPETSHPRERRLAVGIGIALAALVFVAAAGLLYLRWATMREPTCIFIVEASPSLRGAEVTVDGVKLVRAHKSTIGAGERFSIPFYLDYGTYSVRVTMNDAVVFESDVVFDEDRSYRRLDLTQYTPPPARAGQSGAATTSSSSSWLPPLPPPRLVIPGETNRGSGLSQ